MWLLDSLAACERPDHLAPAGDVSLSEARLRVLGSAPVDDEDAELGYYGLDASRGTAAATDFGGGVRIVDLSRGDDRLVTLGFAVSTAVVGDSVAVGWRLEGGSTERAANPAASVLPPGASTFDEAAATLTNASPPSYGTVDHQVVALGDRLGVWIPHEAWIFDDPRGELELGADARVHVTAPDALVALIAGELDGPAGRDLVAVSRSGVDVAPLPASGEVALGPGLPGIDFGPEIVDVGGAAIGDLTGDGVDDLAVAAGSVWVFAGPIRSRLGLQDAVAVLRPSAAPALAPWSVAVGDIDGDGVGDLVAGAPGDASSLPGGAVAIWYGPVDGQRALPEADARLLGEAAGDGAGHRVAALDTTGDGFDDLVIDAVEAESGRGAVYVVDGGPR